MADVSVGTETVDYYVAGKSMVGDYEEYVDESERSLDDETFLSGVGRVGVNVSENLRVEGLTVWGRDRINYAQPRDDDPATAADESVTAPPNQFRTTNRNALYALTVDHDVSQSVGYEAGFTMYDVKAVRFSITEDLAHRDRPQRTETAFASAYVDTNLTDWLDTRARWEARRRGTGSKSTPVEATRSSRSPTGASTWPTPSSSTDGSAWTSACGPWTRTTRGWSTTTGSQGSAKPAGTGVVIWLRKREGAAIVRART